MKNKDTFITITGLNHYLGTNPFRVGRLVKLIKEEDNPHDSDAIRIVMPYLDTVGYVANSVYTVYQGTLSASRIYERTEETAYAQVMFITRSSVIARLLTKEEAVEIFNSQNDFFSDITPRSSSEGLSSDFDEGYDGVLNMGEDAISF